jgi:predicted nucleotidyltransferase
MMEMVEQNLDLLGKLCDKYHVKILELFGSAATGQNFDSQKSDIDFLVEFEPLKPGQYADTYFGFLEALEKLFNRHIDLVMSGAVKNPYFLKSINRHRKVLYEN